MSSAIAGALPQFGTNGLRSAPLDGNSAGRIGKLMPKDMRTLAIQAAAPRCSDGHELCRFSPQVDGFCCEECGDDLYEGGQYLRCDGCGGLTYCYSCVGCASPPSQTGLTNAHHSKRKSVSDACQKTAPKFAIHGHAIERPRTIKSLMTVSDDELALALASNTPTARNSTRISPVGAGQFKGAFVRDDDLDLAIALSLSEASCDDPSNSINGCNSTLHTSSMLNTTINIVESDGVLDDEFAARPFDAASRCYVCGSFTKSPLRLDDPECPHVACTLGCYLSLHPKWLDLKYELLELDNSLP